MPVAIDEVVNSAEIRGYYKMYDKNEQIDWIGEAFWPVDTIEDITVEFLKTQNIVVNALAASTIDSDTLIRSREGFSIDKRQLAYFSESMEIGNQERYDLLKLDKITSPFAKPIVKKIYNDWARLRKAADIVAEMMRMQLLFPISGGPKISIGGKDNTVWMYDYDSDGKWATNNRVDLNGVNLWTNPLTAKPLDDIECIIDKSNVKITRMIMNKKTFNLMVKCQQIQDIFITKTNAANTRVTSAMVKEYIKSEYGITVYLYDRTDRDEAGNIVTYAPVGYIAFAGDEPMGNTVYGITPDELARMENKLAEITTDSKKVATKKYTEPRSNLTTLTVSEMLLPTYENMYNVYLMFVGTPGNTDTQLKLLTATSEDGTASGTSKFTVSNMVDSTNNTLRIKAYADGTAPEVPNYLDYSYNWKDSSAYTSGEDFTVASGTTVEIRELNADGRCVAYVVVTAVSKA